MKYEPIMRALTDRKLLSQYLLTASHAMKKPTTQQAVVVGVLGMFASAAVFALVITYMGYLPTISSFPWYKSDATAAEYSYRIAQNSFAIAALSGGVLGFAVPKIFRISRDKYGKHAD